MIEVQIATARKGIPHPSSLRRWASVALRSGPQPSAPSLQPKILTLRIVGAAEGRRLNRRWRGKDKTTNVLSFPAGEVPLQPDEPRPLGDVVICAPVIRREAREQGKSPAAHFAHMVVHGTLHLLGFDHEAERDATVMERREKRLLAGLGFADPYLLLKDVKPR